MAVAEIPFRPVRIVLVAIAIGGVLYLHGDYGITWDEPNQHQYGKHVVRYYETLFADRSAMDYLDAYLYGGLFDTVAALLVRVSPLGVFETRHLLNAVVGLAGVLAVWKTARLVGGAGAAGLAAGLLLFEPSWFGHMFNNPKDIPFAVGYTWSIYFLLRCLAHLPRIPWRLQLQAGLAIGLTLGVRVGGLILLGYLLVAAGLFLAAPATLTHATAATNPGWRERARDLARSVAGIAAAAFAVMLVFWPWAQHNPLLRPFEALAFMSRFRLTDTGLLNRVLIGGEYHQARDLPVTYLPHYLVVKLPEALLLGLLVAAVVFARSWSRTGDRLLVARVTLVVLSAVLPVCYAIAVGAVLYDTMRHFLFIIPSLCVVAGLGWTAAGARLTRRWAGRRQLLAAIAAVGLLLAPQGYRLAVLHPHQYVHYNALVGGPSGAQGRYELDYWGNSYKEAVELLRSYVRQRDADSGNRLYRVWAAGPERSASYYYPDNFLPVPDARHADFAIAFTRWDIHEQTPGMTIARVRRQGATLAVVKEMRAGAAPAAGGEGRVHR